MPPRLQLHNNQLDHGLAFPLPEVRQAHTTPSSSTVASPLHIIVVILSPSPCHGEADFTHAIQDEDHGAPSSQQTNVSRKGHQQREQPDAPQDSYSSFCSSSIEGGYPKYTYNCPKVSDCPPVTWVYEWVECEWYAQLYGQWQSTAPWIGQSWQDYKAGLLQQHGLMLMSTEEYNMAYRQWNY